MSNKMALDALKKIAAMDAEGVRADDLGRAAVVARAAIAALEEEPPKQEAERDWSTAQDWRGMDGAIAWHLIDRHADGWDDVGAMMNAWLAAQAEPQGWRPISEAPKDGTDILLAIIDAEHSYIDHVERGYFEVVAEDEEDGPWDMRDGEPWCSYEGRSEGLYWCYACGPDDFNRRGIRFLDSSDCLKYTHWMPLPTPPKD
jgi:nitroreductase